MKKHLFPLVFLFAIIPALLIFSGCRSKPEEIITKRIQYDVNIKSPNPNYDWWIQNLVGPQREKLVEAILQGAATGKFKAYDYFYQPLSKQAVARILADTIAVKVRETMPPYALKDTLIIRHIGIKQVLRIRFLEEWRINPKTMQFTKTIKGIAPVARRIDAKGNVQWQPLFWIFPNPATVKKLQQTH
jgi:hypothetical protein